MVKEIQYTNIRRVLDNLMEHPMLRDLTLEQAVKYTIRFIGLHGYPKLYQYKEASIEIEDFRGILPCDLISIIQVKDLATGICLRSMTDNFVPGEAVPGSRGEADTKSRPAREENRLDGKELLNGEVYIPKGKRYLEEPSFKTQGRIIFTSFPHGCVQVAYRSIPVDEDGFPLLVDNENYLAALEAYIKKMVFTIKFDTGNLPAAVLQNAQREYAWLAGELQDEFLVQSLSEMESITRMWNTLIPQVRHFDDGFKNLGNREYIRRHR